jgi:hypothetical protein
VKPPSLVETRTRIDCHGLADVLLFDQVILFEVLETRETSALVGAEGAAIGRAGIVVVSEIVGVTPLNAPLSVATRVHVPGEEP